MQKKPQSNCDRRASIRLPVKGKTCKSKIKVDTSITHAFGNQASPEGRDNNGKAKPKTQIMHINGQPRSCKNHKA
ncbi:hypothetical protein XENTR_v10017091 [Xenopus tropicalis]|nr:hypothetical protein XENTR_v10017091 [Xenopus tropicalis]